MVFLVTFGGSINLKGTNYLRRIREIDKVLKFLENFKRELKPDDKLSIEKTVDLIVDYMNKLSEGKLEE